MNCRNRSWAIAILFSVILGHSGAACAQGLIWELPEEDGTWIRYEGTSTLTELRPDSAAGDETAEWLQHLTLKSVGQEMAEYDGKMQPCRWIEIESVTGTPTEEGIDPGPTGRRIVKVLVPESRVIPAQVDDTQILVSYLPIVKGYRKIGEKPAVEIKSKVLQVYPLLTLLPHFRRMSQEGTEEDADVALGPAIATRLKGTRKLENHVSRSTNEATLWRSSDVPFGLARWTVKVSHEAKKPTEDRGAFQQHSEAEIEMQAVESGADAQSRVVAP